MPCVFDYYFRPDHDSEKLLLEELKRATAYRKRLVDIEVAKRAAVVALENELVPELGQIRAALALLEEEHPMHKAAEKKALRQQIKPARAALEAFFTPGREAFAERKKGILHALGAAGPRTKERVNLELFANMQQENEFPQWLRLQQIQMDAVAAIKQARATNGLCSGTSGLVDEEVEGAKRTPVGFGKHHQVRRLGIQLTTKNDVQDLFTGRSPALVLEQLPATQWDTRSGQDHAFSRTMIRLGAKPELVIRGRTTVQRPLPPDAKILYAILVLDNQQRYRHPRWKLQLTATKNHSRTYAGKGKAAVWIHWDRRPGLVVAPGKKPLRNPLKEHIVFATVFDGQHTRQLCLESKVLQRELYYAHIQGVARGISKATMPQLCNVIRNLPPDVVIWRWRDGERVSVPVRLLVGELDNDNPSPILMRQCVESFIPPGTFKQWWEFWKAECDQLSHDYYTSSRDTVFDFLVGQGLTLNQAEEFVDRFHLFLWWKKDRHLNAILANGLSRNARIRKHFFRIVARELRHEFDHVVVSNEDFARKKLVTPRNTDLHQTAPGLFRNELLQVFGPDGVTKLSLEPVSTAPDEPPETAELAVLRLWAASNAETSLPPKESSLRALRQKKRSRGITHADVQQSSR